MPQKERTEHQDPIVISADVLASANDTWNFFTHAKHVIRWNHASDDWHSVSARNDVREGGKFLFRMEAKNGSFGFDFSGVYERIEKPARLQYRLDDGRMVDVRFEPATNPATNTHETSEATNVTISFDPEASHSIAMQREGWQAILNNFKAYAQLHAEKRWEVFLFEITINAPPRTVYEAVTDKELFSCWTRVFHPSSLYEGSWDAGAKILFLGLDAQGCPEGLSAVVTDNIPHSLIALRYVGVVSAGAETTTSEDALAWRDARERYVFRSAQGGKATELLVDTDVLAGDCENFQAKWNEALAELKKICETKAR